MHTFAVIWWSKGQAPRAGKLEVGAGFGVLHELADVLAPPHPQAA